MSDSWEHRPDQINDRRGQKHPLFKHKREDLLWGRVINDEVTISLIYLERWTELHRKAAELTTLQEKYAKTLKPEEDLLEEYIGAILKLVALLENNVNGPIGQLKLSVPASPNCRHFFIREAHDNPKQIENFHSAKSRDAFSKVESEFFWLLGILWQDGTARQDLRLTNILDEMQRMIGSERQIKDLISPYAASQISDLSIMAECLRQLELYQPWAKDYRDQMEDRLEAIEADFDTWRKPFDAVKHFGKGKESDFAQYGTPTGKRFHYPIDKRRTRENHEALKEAEINLDTFWLHVDELLHRYAGELRDTTIRKLMLQPRSLQRTPEWVEPTKTATGGKPEIVQVEDLCRPLSELYFDLERRTEKTTDKTSTVRQAKTKAKTRGEPSTVDQQAEVDVPAAEPTPDPQPTFAVDNRALKVFRTLFYTPPAGATPGEVPWADFLWAMASTGFKPEKLYGSVWQFTPTVLDVEKPIQIHEPHGSMNGKIPYFIARRHGRRLTRSCGWHGEMFVLAEGASRTSLRQ